MSIKTVPKRLGITLSILAVLMVIGALFPSPEETESTTTASPTTPPTREESPLKKHHNGFTGREFVDFCLENAATELLQNPQTAKHPNLFQRNDPYISSLGDWAWSSWVEGANLYGVQGRINYACWRTANGKVTIKAVP